LACRWSCWARRSRVFFSAITLAVPLRTSTRVSSISWMTMRIIFSGFSALSSRELMLELMMSDSLENMLICCLPRVNGTGVEFRADQVDPGACLSVVEQNPCQFQKIYLTL